MKIIQYYSILFIRVLTREASSAAGSVASAGLGRAASFVRVEFLRFLWLAAPRGRHASGRASGSPRTAPTFGNHHAVTSDLRNLDKATKHS